MKKTSKASSQLLHILMQRLASINAIISAHLNTADFETIEPIILTRQRLIALLLEKFDSTQFESITHLTLQESLAIDRKIITALNKEKSSTLSSLKELYLHKNKFSGYNLSKVI